MHWDVTIKLDSTVYSLNVVQRVVYALASSVTISVWQADNLITLNAVPTLLMGSGSQLTADAARELIQRNLNDFALREQVQRETSGLREIIASAALRGAGV